MTTDSQANVTAWNTVLFEKWCRYKHLITVGMSPHSEQALRRYPHAEGSRVLDIGCGFGDTTMEIARRVGPKGQAVGVDCAENFVLASQRDAAAAGVENTRFFVADVQTDPLDGPYDAAFSRFGTMFFNFPGAALGNINRALKPGGELTMVVWRMREENDWLYLAEQTVREIVPVTRAEDSDQPTCGPGPFSMAGPDMMSAMMQSVGFENVRFERFDSDVCIGVDLDEAVQFALDVGPSGEIVRLAGEEGARLRPAVTEALRERFRDRVTDAGLHAGSSAWIINGRKPA